LATVRLSARPRRWPLIVIIALVVAGVVFTALSGFVIDLLWYREIDQSAVFWKTLETKIALGAVFGILFGALLYVNIVIAQRLRPTTRILTPEQEVLERIRDISDPFLRWLIPLGCTILGLLVAIGVSHEWQTFLLWRNSGGVTFGNPEPLFDRDPAFYIFTLPWLRFLQGWLFSALVGVTILTAIGHLLWGGIAPQAPAFGDKVTPAARAHLSVLLGLIMLVKAWGYWLGRYDLLTSPRGVVEGASYTDVRAQLPALNFLAVVAVICAILFFLNIRLRQWSLPIIAVGLLALVSVLLGTAYPAFIQQVRVKPNEQALETPYIQHNIDATRTAFGLDPIDEQEHLRVGGALDPQQLDDNEVTTSNIRLWRPIPIMLENFQSLQRIRQYYDFSDVDVDRYTIEGQRRVIMIGPREVSQAGLTTTAQTWLNEHLAYTHGYGAAAAQVNSATSQGQPVFSLSDLPPQGEPEMAQPRIYYGERNDVPYVVVGTKTEELDFGATNEQYLGDGGIPLSNLLVRAMFAWHFRDYNLLVSGSINSSSRIMIYREIKARVEKAVPFLGFDSDPYFAIVDGNPEWILDAYTATDEYPYSQSVDVGTATDGLLQGQVNYLRNSVKVVVDAYTGKITYYADLTEPMIQAWAQAFPGLFTDITAASTDLRAHFRYPENLFQVQSYEYANYHVTEAASFYQKRDFWQIPGDPTADTNADGSQPAMRPYYQLIRLPGEQTEQFTLVIPFLPEDRLNMVAWMTASSDPETYGKITSFRLPEGRNIEGPTQVFARINQDPTFSAQRTLLGSGGSEVLFGDFLIIPIDDSFLYVLPVYVRSSQEAAVVPELKKVLIVNGSGGTVAIGDSLPEALRAAVSGQPSGGNGPPPTGSVRQQVEQLLASAQSHYEAAQNALTTGDLATYQSEIDAAQADVARANDLLTSGAGSTPPPTPLPSGSPSPTASATASPSA
jgi:uncharacterized membrane protein (UPF0182 family)